MLDMLPFSEYTYFRYRTVTPDRRTPVYLKLINEKIKYLASSLPYYLLV